MPDTMPNPQAPQPAQPMDPDSLPPGVTPQQLTDGQAPLEALQYEIGVTGLRYSGGLPMDQPLRQLAGMFKSTEVFTEMSRYDDMVGAVLFAIESLVRQVSWDVRPGDDTPQALQQADFVDSNLHDMSHTWEDLLANAISFLPLGWAFHELVYKRRRGRQRSPGESSRYGDGKLGWRKIPGRAQITRDRWEFDDDGGIKALVQRDPNSAGLYTIPLQKGLLFRASTAKGNPEGRSILERSFRAWYFKKRLQEIEAIGVERDLAGLPIAWVPPSLLNTNASDADKAKLQATKDMLVNIRRDEQDGIAMPLVYDQNGNKLWDLTLLTTGGTRQFDTNTVLQRYDRAIAGTMLADFILLGHEKSGSWALSSDKTELFGVALGAYLDEIAAVFNRHAIPRLLQVNGMPLNAPPHLVHGDIETVDLERLGNFIKALSQSGAAIFPNPELEAWLAAQAGMPAASEAGAEL